MVFWYDIYRRIMWWITSQTGEQWCIV